jgi:hypothetical protein
MASVLTYADARNANAGADPVGEDVRDAHIVCTNGAYVSAVRAPESVVVMDVISARDFGAALVEASENVVSRAWSEKK